MKRDRKADHRLALIRTLAITTQSERFHGPGGSVGGAVERAWDTIPNNTRFPGDDGGQRQVEMERVVDW